MEFKACSAKEILPASQIRFTTDGTTLTISFDLPQPMSELLFFLGFSGGGTNGQERFESVPAGLAGMLPDLALYLHGSWGHAETQKAGTVTVTVYDCEPIRNIPNFLHYLRRRLSKLADRTYWKESLMDMGRVKGLGSAYGAYKRGAERPYEAVLQLRRFARDEAAVSKIDALSDEQAAALCAYHAQAMIRRLGFVATKYGIDIGDSSQVSHHTFYEVALAIQLAR